MINMPELTADLLAELSHELGGCTFDDEPQRTFLASTQSCDVQAAPGNGKTTLLVAKLSLLSRNWQRRDQGVCVVSHTNAAREEVQCRLGRHPTAFTFLSYPHYIGTVTGFIDQYVALPFLRGLAWPIRRIDDDAFAVEAKKLITTKWNLRNSHARAARQVEGWVENLTFSTDLHPVRGEPPVQIEVQNRGNRQPGAATRTGAELEQIKGTLTRRGLYRFADMMAVARIALRSCPQLADRVRRRFPLAILDEAQDTHGEQLELLETLFGGQGAIFQRLGDQNQTLYEDAAVPAEQYWRPVNAVIPLNVTRRFGPAIARTASRLTARVPQAIEAHSDRPGHRALICFENEAILSVLPAYADWVARHRPNGGRDCDVRAVASRHNLYRDQRGGWPKSLVDYHPSYRSGGGRGARIASFCGIMRKIAAAYCGGRPMQECQRLLGVAIVDYLDHRRFAHPDGVRVTAANVWQVLGSDPYRCAILIRQMVIEHVLRGGAASEQVRWTIFCETLAQCMNFQGMEAAGEFCAFDPEGAIEEVDDFHLHDSARFGNLNIRLGSVHSVKGLTSDAMLMMESEVYRGPAVNQQVMDLEAVLPHVFGVVERDLSATDVLLAATTNVFVAATRPRDMVAFAVRSNAIDAAVRAAARVDGWELIQVAAN
jgi:DNA helicase-2/ATP-dependent DNA helicase PcrA